MYNPHFVGFLLQMNTDTRLIDWCLHVLYPASAVVSSVVMQFLLYLQTDFKSP